MSFSSVLGSLALRRGAAPRGWPALAWDPCKCNSRSNSTFHNLDYVPIKPSLTTSYIHGAMNMPLVGKTIGQCLDETVNKHPDKEAVVFLRDGVRKTFGQLKQEADKMAAGLLAIGLEKGDRLGICGPNVYEWLLIQLATAQAGIIMTNINPAYQPRELQFVLKKVGCKALVCPMAFKTQKYYDFIKQICPEIEKATAGDVKSTSLPELKSVIMIGGKPPGTFSFKEVYEAASSRHHEQLLNVQKKMSFDDPINIQFTSGTTGYPKGATLSHHNVVNNAQFIGYRVGYDWQDARLCAPVPLFHTFGCVGASLMLVIYGCHISFPSPSFEGQAALQTVKSERCTMLYGTPTMYIDMLNQKNFSSFDLSSLQGAIVAGSPCPQELSRRIISKMKIAKLTGCSENEEVKKLQCPP